MSRGTLLGAAIGVGALVWSSGAVAQQIDVIDYQGRLVDAGSPASGQFSLRFRLYDQPTGGTLLAEHTSSVIIAAGVNGVFHADDLPFASYFTGEALWMEIGVTPQGGSMTVLDPRQPIALAPQAAYAQRSGTTLNDALANGNDIDTSSEALRIAGSNGLDVDTTFDVGGPENGLFRLYVPFTGNPVVSFRNDGTRGGRVDVRDTSNNNVVVTQVDPSGGGLLTVARDGSGNTGFLVDGNAGGSGATRVDITGETSSAIFDMSESGNASVVLPDESVGPAELFAEPGVAERHDNNISIDLTGSIEPITSRSITVPAPGYVLAIGNLEILVGFTSGSDQVVIAAVSNEPDAFFESIEHAYDVPGSLATGTYNFNISSSLVFPVNSAGTYTYYLDAYESGGISSNIVRAQDTQLTLLYVPTAYGQVGLDGRLPAGNVPDGTTPGRIALTPREIAAEQLAEVKRHNASLLARQIELEARLDEQQRRLDALLRATNEDE